MSSVGGKKRELTLLSNYNLNAPPSTDECASAVLADLHSKYNLDQYVLSPELIAS